MTRAPLRIRDAQRLAARGALRISVLYAHRAFPVDEETTAGVTISVAPASPDDQGPCSDLVVGLTVAVSGGTPDAAVEAALAIAHAARQGHAAARIALQHANRPSCFSAMARAYGPGESLARAMQRLAEELRVLIDTDEARRARREALPVQAQERLRQEAQHPDRLLQQAAQVLANPPVPEQAPEEETPPAPEQAPEEETPPAPEQAPEKKTPPAPEQAPEKKPSPAPEQAPEKKTPPAPEQAPEKKPSPAPEQAPEKKTPPAPEQAPEKKPSPAPEQAPPEKHNQAGAPSSSSGSGGAPQPGSTPPPEGSPDYGGHPGRGGDPNPPPDPGRGRDDASGAARQRARARADERAGAPAAPTRPAPAQAGAGAGVGGAARRRTPRRAADRRQEARVRRLLRQPADDSRLQAPAHGGHGHARHGRAPGRVYARLQAPSALTIERMRRILARLAGDGAEEGGPRLDHRAATVRLLTHRSMLPARKQERGRPAIMVIADVSGSCDAFAQPACDVASAAARIGVPGADVVTLTVCTPNWWEQTVRGGGFTIAEVMVNGRPVKGPWPSTGRSAAFVPWDELFRVLARAGIGEVQVIIALGDPDECENYASLAARPTTRRFIWLDNYLGRLVGEPHQPTRSRENAVLGGFSDAARRITTYVVGCRDAETMLEALELVIARIALM